MSADQIVRQNEDNVKNELPVEMTITQPELHFENRDWGFFTPKKLCSNINRKATTTYIIRAYTNILRK